MLKHAREKLQRKRLDLIVANDITREGAGFDKDTNIVTLLAHDTNDPIELPLMSKLETAHRILDEIAHLRRLTVVSSSAIAAPVA